MPKWLTKLLMTLGLAALETGTAVAKEKFGPKDPREAAKETRDTFRVIGKK